MHNHLNVCMKKANAIEEAEKKIVKLAEQGPVIIFGYAVGEKLKQKLDP